MRATLFVLICGLAIVAIRTQREVANASPPPQVPVGPRTGCNADARAADDARTVAVVAPRGREFRCGEPASPLPFDSATIAGDPVL
jgi:hypothetical protein